MTKELNADLKFWPKWCKTNVSHTLENAELPNNAGMLFLYYYYYYYYYLLMQNKQCNEEPTEYF